MFGLGAGELFLIFLFALIFIGPKKLPELAKGLGKGIREFNKAREGLMDEINKTSSEISSDTNQSSDSQDLKNADSKDHFAAHHDQETVATSPEKSKS